MVDFEHIHLTEDVPIYLQLIRHVKREIAAGHVSMSEEMPSRRTLSALLGVNPNTIQRAYRFLEEEGIIESRAGAKSYIMVDEKRREVIRQEFLHYEIEQSAKALQSLGISREEAVEMFTTVWCELEENTIPHSASGSEIRIRGE